MDYSLFGHQIVCHEVKGYNAASIHNAVDGDPVPVPHFGMALTPQDFHSLAEKVKSGGIKFILEPHLRFKGAQNLAPVPSPQNSGVCTQALCLFPTSQHDVALLSQIFLDPEPV